MDLYEWHALINNIYLEPKGQITNKYNHHGQNKKRNQMWWAKMKI